MRAVEAILASYETKTLKAKLLEFPALIREAKTKLNAARQAMKDAEQALKETEAELTAAIAGEVNPSTLKPAFPNAEARAAELAKRKKDDPACQVATKVYRDAEWAFNEAQGDLEMLCDQFKAYRYIVDLTARELAVLAGGMAEEQRETTVQAF